MKTPRILFVSEAAAASPTRYRALAFFGRLRSCGWDPRHIAVTGLWRRAFLLHAARSAEVIVILRKQLTPAFCRILRGRGRRLVLDIDDALFAQDDGAEPPLIARRFAAMAGSVDQVWAGNEFLAERAAGFCANRVVLPTSVDPDLYVAAKRDGAAVHESSHFDLVWIGSSSTRKYLEGILPMLAEAAKRIPLLRLKIIADFDLPQAKEMGLRTVAIPWSAATEARELATADVGLGPLPDDRWTRGKCGLKVLQYMAAGLPVIGSPVGVQSDMIMDGGTGFLAATTEDWLSAIGRLHEQPPLRAAMGAAGRERVMAHYSLDVAFKKMVGALSILLSGDRGVFLCPPR